MSILKTIYDRSYNKDHGIQYSWILKKTEKVLVYSLLLPYAFLAVVIIRLIAPWVLVRIGGMPSPSRIGHFAANTEIYIINRKHGINLPQRRRIIDLFFISPPVCNQQLAIMWKRELTVFPYRLLVPVYRLNNILPNKEFYMVPPSSNSDRDIYNLLEGTKPTLQFTKEEELRGKSILNEMGISSGSKFVCMTVRDSAYLSGEQGRDYDYSYHNYRDSEVNDYVLAAETLADHGIFVIRMGVKVNHPIKSSHPRVIDYACNGMRTEFMDMYLGSKCFFCISQGTGFDAVPLIFRRPVVYVNMVPLFLFNTFLSSVLGIFKHHIDTKSKTELTFKKIYNSGAGYCQSSKCYEEKNIKLLDNSPEEIRDVVMEMYLRLNGGWLNNYTDDINQKNFWKNYPADATAGNGERLHGEIRSRIGAQFLRDNMKLLE